MTALLCDGLTIRDSEGLENILKRHSFDVVVSAVGLLLAGLGDDATWNQRG